MNSLISILVGLVAFTHFYILIFEMFAWESRGKKVFSNFPDDLFAKTTALAANMGLYNGFLCAGLVWTYFITDMSWQLNIRLFFLTSIAIAGIFGALTAERKIFFVQALPALVTMLLILLG